MLVVGVGSGRGRRAGRFGLVGNFGLGLDSTGNVGGFGGVVVGTF